MESLKLKTKLFYLLLIVGSGLTVIGLIGYFNIQTIKRHMDTLYFGSLLPLGELNAINNAYNDELAAPVYRWSHRLISDEQAAQSITIGLSHIDQMWAGYLSHHKRPEEIAYVDYAESQIDQMERYFLGIQGVILDPKRSHPLSLTTLSDNVTSIGGTIRQLIAYENAAARYEHAILANHYKNALTQLVLFLCVILIIVMGLAWNMFAKIESQQQLLLESARTLKHLNLKLEQASYTDSLTSLYNRRYFNLLYDREFKRALRAGKPFVFLMLDIDFFKQYNDTYGHLQGDQALQAVAKVLKSTLQRPGDYPFRLGGEEFGVIITDGDCQNGRVMGEKIRSGIEELKMEHKGSKIAQTLTVSIGGICFTPTIHIGDEALIHAADINLYAAKERGRNQVVFSDKL